jgi:two-component system sensor histidine kinase BaeS
MRSSLLWKHVAITLLTIVVVIAIVWLAIDYLAADYFMVLMKRYNISATETNDMFLDAVHRYLLWASLAALVLAVLGSFVLTRKVLQPLSEMIVATRHIAAGEYADRVLVTSRDEVGQLAVAFNHMADRLQHIEQLRRTLVSDVAHELRTPLTNLRGYLEALRDEVVEPTPDLFELLHDETLRLVTLAEDLLQLTRAEAARSTLHPQRIVLQNIVGQVLEMMQPQFDAKHIDVVAPAADGEDVISADADKLAQALRNLLQNALQYTPCAGQVRILTETSADRIKLTVCNTGEGIAEGDLPYIFERFYRGEKSRSRDHGGAGIGLTIVKELIEAHGGQVGTASTATETRIWFTLPI